MLIGMLKVILNCILILLRDRLLSGLFLIHFLIVLGQSYSRFNFMRIFTLYDKVSEVAAPPVFARNEAEAIRSVERSFANAYRSIPSFKWTDFKLCEIGEFDESTMVLSPCTPIREVYFDFTPPSEENTNG